MVFGCFFRWSDHPIPRSVQDLGLARHVLLGSEELLQAWATGSTTRLWSGNLVYCIESRRSFWGCFWGCNGDIFLVSNEIMIYSKPQKVNQTVGKLDLFFVLVGESIMELPSWKDVSASILGPYESIISLNFWCFGFWTGFLILGLMHSPKTSQN